jgi:hypothetical protein
VGVELFTIKVFLTKYPPIEVTGAISVIYGIYIGVKKNWESDTT